MSIHYSDNKKQNTTMATIDQIDARIKQISDAFSASQKQIADLNVEYNQLLGYKQALLDSQTANEPTTVKEVIDPLDQPGLLEG